ncbi:MAG: hypothetical protein KJ950_10385 [Proteobacteria bacterium]|nr:hypothetical protein [Pseudomonadota bacterium]MBU1687517.1 hypothetical protein [Pseudomonadota bacterium]
MILLKIRIIHGLALGGMLFLMACATGANSGQSETLTKETMAAPGSEVMAEAPPVVTTTEAGKPLAVFDLLRKKEVSPGQTVELSGQFMGWKGTCLTAPPVSRSDWMLVDSTGCIYVTGAIPVGLDPAKPNLETILVKGRLAADQKGKAYLEAESVTVK